MNTTQHTSPPCAAAAARAITHTLCGLTRPPNHRAVLIAGMHRSQPHTVRPAPMPQTQTGGQA